MSSMDVTEAARLLGVSEDAAREEISNAFRTRSRKLHPDNGGDEEEFRRLNEAKTVLLARALHDPQQEAKEILEREEERGKAEAQKRIVAVFLKLTAEEMEDGGQYTVTAKMRVPCTECNGSLSRKDLSSLEVCHACVGKKYTAPTRGNVTRCNLCFGSGKAITESNMCNMCKLTGKVVVRKRIRCTVPERSKDNDLVGVVRGEDYDLRVFLKLEEDDSDEEPPAKRHKENGEDA